jgi:CRISPR type I-E-associated protein CasB/Cse2
MENTEIVNYLLSLRESSSARPALRRGASMTTETYAYPYMARWWQGRSYLRRPTLILAAMAAGFPGIAQKDRVGLGHLAARVTRAQELGFEGVERKLIAAQAAPLERLVPTLRTLLAAAERCGTPLDWNSLWGTLRNWDHPDETRRTYCRRRVIEEFYQNQPTHESEETNPKETNQ